MSKLTTNKKVATHLMPRSEHIIRDWRVPRAAIRWCYWAIALVPLSLFIAFIWSTIASSNAREAERKAANAATQLAPGIRESWLAAIDQKLDERLVAAGGLIKFAESGGNITWAPAQLVSVNCNPHIGIWLEYGTSEYSAELALLNYRERPSLGSGVGAQSPAAGQLLEEVCKRVTFAVRRVSEMR